MNIVPAIFERNSDDAPSIIHGGREISYGELHDRVRHISSTLKSHVLWPQFGVPRVALSFPSSPDYIALALAILNAGGCFLPLPDELTECERDQLIAITGADLLLTGESELTALHHDTPPGFSVHALESLNPAFIRFSSGTTGQAKGVVLSHLSLLERITAANQVLRIGRGDRVLWMLPMAHHFAVSIVLYLYHGATTVLVPPGNLLKPACDHGVSVIYGSPYHFAMIAAEPDAAPLPDLRLAVSTAFALPESTAQLFLSKFSLPIQQALGIIEAGLPLLNLDSAETNPCSIGKPTPSFQAKLDEETGELLLKGPGMLDAYLSPWQLRESILQNGWFATGDIVECDTAGHYFLRGRTRTVINVGGLKCFPEEVESVLRQHPSVADARVLRGAHPGLGAVPMAEVVLRDPSQPPSVGDLRRHCQRQLSAYKVPFGYQFVSALSLTSNGKVLR